MFKKSFRAVSIAMILSMVLALVPTGFAFAKDANVSLTSMRQEGEPVTLYTTNSSVMSSNDPQIASDVVSIASIENLFLGLVDADPLVPGNIRNELATEFSFDDTGTVWTFNIRNDVPWVRWDPVNDEAEIVRMVTAYDVEYGIKRACDPRLGGMYGPMVAQMVVGCNEVNTKALDEVTDADFDVIEVMALDDTTVEIHLQFSAGYFLSQLAMWTYRPVPQEVIEEYGNDWTLPGNIVTSGPYVMDEWIRGVRRVYKANPFFPADMHGPGNIERLVITVVEDIGTQFALYQDNQVEQTNVPAAELQAVLESEDYADELQQVADLAVFYFGFAHDKAPFDNVHARRAFSASIDRNKFVQDIRQNRGVPMIHFTPPGMFGASPINERGVGYNPEFARSELELAGYPNCEGFPAIEVLTYSGAGTWAEFLAAAVETELGCDPNNITVEQVEFSVLLEITDAENAPEDRPNIWTLGWGPDYPDSHNWVFDAGIHCESDNDFKRPCSEVDDLITAAARESDPEVRKEMYARIDDMLFGEEGEQPIIPLYMRLDYLLVKPWYTGPFETDGLFGGPHWDWRTIDQEAQTSARSG